MRPITNIQLTYIIQYPETRPFGEQANVDFWSLLSAFICSVDVDVYIQLAVANAINRHVCISQLKQR